MSDYYEWKLDSLQDALEFANSYRAMRKGLVFRGQRKAIWELKSGLFRGNPSQDEIDDRFRKTRAFVQWCRQNPRLPDYSDDQLLQIAQHYGMYTDLLDFSTSAETAAFFALGSPPSPDYVANTSDCAAIFLVDPADLEHLSRIAAKPALSEMLPTLMDVLALYAGAYQANQVMGLSRLVAQDGVFVRDVGGTFENLVDGHMSLLPALFEEEVGHPLLIKKASFRPRKGDIDLLYSLGCSFSRLFPPPNDLEREIGRFFDAYSEAEYHERAKDDGRIVVTLTSRRYVSCQRHGTWDAPEWEAWTKLDFKTARFRRPTHRQEERWDIPEAELNPATVSASLMGYVKTSIARVDDFRSSIELCITSADGDKNLPERIQTLLEVLSAFPYSCEELELALRKSIALFVDVSSSALNADDFACQNEASRKALDRVFQVSNVRLRTCMEDFGWSFPLSL